MVSLRSAGESDYHSNLSHVDSMISPPSQTIDLTLLRSLFHSTIELKLLRAISLEKKKSAEYILRYAT